MNGRPIKTILAHIADSRADYFSKREPLALEDMNSLDWLKQAGVVIESPLLHSTQNVRAFASKVAGESAQSLLIHIPIWADPIFAIKLHNLINLPILLLGNNRPDTSSLVGLLGAGGALDQIGVQHERIFDHTQPEARRDVLAFLRAAAAVKSLKGQTLGLFGNRSLGIFTAGYDPVQWQRIFGVDVENHDQCEIVHRAGQFKSGDISRHMEWLVSHLGGVKYLGNFTPAALEKQVRSYLATKELASNYQLDFVGVKCQPELSDGYVTQCVSHCLFNGNLDADGSKAPFVHACESDADGALTMQILNHLTEGKPASLLDIRWYNGQNHTWILANCGAVAASFLADDEDPSGFGHLTMQAHVFGSGGGGSLGGSIRPQSATLARLCRKNGEYWMAILPGMIQPMEAEDLAKTTNVFPQACVQVNTNDEFIRAFGSNHIHMVNGDYRKELIAYCKMTGVPWRIWE